MGMVPAAWLYYLGDAAAAADIAVIQQFAVFLVRHHGVAVTGHEKWATGDVTKASIIIEVAISATTEATAVQTAANALLAKAKED